VLSFNLFIARSLEKAHGIAAVSRAAADEITRGFGVRREKIEVVPNGVDGFFSPGSADEIRRFGITENDYILFTGTLEPRKGVAELLDAWERIDRAPRLVLAGDSGWGESSLRRRIESHPRRSEIVVTGYVVRDTLRALYRGALAFVYPSHFEGFGLPPLEAMACGAPVITSDGGALSEVVGDAAVVVPRRDAASLRAAIERVISERALREELVARGFARARLFSWDDSARTIAAMLERAAGG
jgi:alpha-1,3-rhamnosyl/mannosyltransferase